MVIGIIDQTSEPKSSDVLYLPWSISMSPGEGCVVRLRGATDVREQR